MRNQVLYHRYIKHSIKPSDSDISIRHHTAINPSATLKNSAPTPLFPGHNISFLHTVCAQKATSRAQTKANLLRLRSCFFFFFFAYRVYSVLFFFFCYTYIAPLLRAVKSSTCARVQGLLHVWWASHANIWFHPRLYAREMRFFYCGARFLLVNCEFVVGWWYGGNELGEVVRAQVFLWLMGEIFIWAFC